MDFWNVDAKLELFIASLNNMGSRHCKTNDCILSFRVVYPYSLNITKMYKKEEEWF